MQSIVKYSLGIYLLSLLAACGGSSGSSSSNSAPPTSDVLNSAPVANIDNSATSNSQPVSIDVLANDTDDDGDSLTIVSIQSQPENGTVDIIDNQIQYTPNVLALGSDSFVYVLSDGQDTAQGLVNVSNSQSVTISGQITNEALNGANVSISIGNEVVETVSVDAGEYSVMLSSATDGLVQLVANGSAETNHENVQYSSIPGSFSDLLTKAEATSSNSPETDSIRMLNATALDGLNLNEINTALVLLIADLNNNTLPSDFATYTQLAGVVRPDEVLRIASIIRLIVNEQPYDNVLTAPLLSFLNSSDTMTTAQIIDAAIDDLDLANEQFDQDLELARETILAGTSSVASLVTEQLADALAMLVPATQEGYVPVTGEIYQFGGDGSLTYLKSWRVNDGEPQRVATSSWTVSGANVHLEGAMTYNNISLLSSPDDFSIYGQEVVNAMRAIEEQFGGPYLGQLYPEITEYLPTLTVLASIGPNVLVNVQRRESHVFDFPQYVTDAQPILGSGLIIETNTQETLSISPKSLLTGNQTSDVEGTWALTLPARYISNYNRAVYFVDRVEFLPNGQTQFEFYDLGGTWNWELANGIISLSNELGNRFEIWPVLIDEYQQQQTGILIEYDENEEIYSFQVIELAKFSESAPALLDNLITELPEAWMTHLDPQLPSSYTNGMLDQKYLYANEFVADGTLNRFNAYYGAWDYIGIWDYVRADNKLTWTRTRFDNRTRTRTWEPVGFDGSNRALVYQYEFRSVDSNEDGVIDENDIPEIYVRGNLAVYEKSDMSAYEEAWANREF